MHVIATAGHVDHGKSTLIRALTGMEPDRWAQERRRGMTIDLGFAWTDLQPGERLAFIDVPGHERFVSNMLAGAGQVPAALLVVAAHEGWRTQTDEHFDALMALGVRHLVAVVTFADRADPSVATAQTRDRLDAEDLSSAEVVTASGNTGDGLPALRAALGRLVRQLDAPPVTEPARLWIDRSFSIRGAGTVVTGTLIGGRIGVGDELEIAPEGQVTSVRALEACKEPVGHVAAVSRAAVNLRHVAAAALRRGQALVAPGSTTSATVLDVALTTPCGGGQYVGFVGSATVGMRVRPLGMEQSQFCRLTLGHPLPLRLGDRGLLRDPGRHIVLGGFTVLDINPVPLRRRGSAADRATELAAAHGRDPGVDLLRWRGWMTRPDAIALGARLPDAIRETDKVLVSEQQWEAWSSGLTRLVDAGLDDGVSHGELRRVLEIPTDALLDALVTESDAVHAVDGRVRRLDVRPALSTTATLGLERLLRSLAAEPFDPPDRQGLKAMGLDERTLAIAVATGQLVKVGPEVFLRADAIEIAVAELRRLAAPFTVAMARDALQSSRRVVLPLLQHLDATRQTRRVDELLRVVVR